MTHVTLKQLRYFDALSRELHFGRAADACSVTQPALSMQIHELEQSLGLVLVERTRAGVQLTPKGLEIAGRLGVPADKPRAALRALAADRLVSIGGGPFDRVTDGWVLPKPVLQALQARDDGVPLLIGATANEAVIFQLPKDLKNHLSMIEESGPAWQARLLALYPAATDEHAGVASTRLMTDRDFVCPARYVAGRRAAPTWLYLVSAPPASSPEGARLGAYHGADVRFLFNLEFGVPLGDAGRRVGDAMRRYWLRFAATGDPNGADLPAWPAYTIPGRRHLDLGTAIRVDTGLGGARCDLFDEIWNR